MQRRYSLRRRSRLAAQRSGRRQPNPLGGGITASIRTRDADGVDQPCLTAAWSG
jgi:hypothetical protein